jgi:metallophosphoesterase superfamily enzyme
VVLALLAVALAVVGMPSAWAAVPSPPAGRAAPAAEAETPRLVIVGAPGLAWSDLDRDDLRALQRGRDFVWIAGNHDPGRPHGLDGMHADELAVGPITFRHQPRPGAMGEIAGHLHPSARVAGRGRSVRRKCFAGDGHRLVLPAFGAYAGGLNVLDRAFAGLFAAATFRAFMLGGERVYPVGRKALRPD